MCDNRAIWGYSPWNTHFYQQYLQHHARMTQWIQNLHQNIPQPWQNSLNLGNHTCCQHHPNQQLPVIQQGHYIPQQGHYIPQQGYYIPQQGYYIPQQGYSIPQQGQHNPQQGQHNPQQGQHNPQQGYHALQQGYHVPQQEYHVRHEKHSVRHRGNAKHNSHYDTHHRSRSQTSAEYVNDDGTHKQEEDGEDDGSEGELVLNVDAFLAFRAEKEESAKEEDAKTEESFELVDTILDENFEFVELDDAGQLQKIYGRPSVPDAKGDVEYDREARIVLYGDRADRIAGLETSLEIMFDHFNDLHQPVIYPYV